MQVICPHCQSAIETVEERPEEIVCPGCGSSFRLEQERTRTLIEEHQRLGKFELLERVGSGAFGVVWKARDTELGRLVALKIPHVGRVATQQDAERFLREGRSAAQLRHPGIVSVHEVGHHGSLPYIVCDFIEGVTLSELLAVRQFGFREAAELVGQVADALDYAHAMGVVHRDIKASNIMIERPALRAGPEQPAQPTSLGRPLLADFGLALRDEAETTITVEGQVLGTPAYMSPEQAAGLSHKVDARSDVYSLGVVLYRLLAGELPFRGSTRMLIDQVLHEEPRPPRRLNDKIPRDLETICLKAMAKSAARRYPTAREFADDLRRHLNGEPIRARPVGTTERLWRWCRRKLHAGMGQSSEALGCYEQARRVLMNLPDAERVALEVRRDLAAIVNNVALLQHDSGQLAEAIRSYQQALEVRQALVQEKPDRATFQSDLAGTYNNLATAQQDNGQDADALESHQRALQIREKLVTDPP